MITPTPEGYSYVDVSHPVSGEDGKRFRDQAVALGAAVLGADFVSSTTETSLELLETADGMTQPVVVDVVSPIGRPLFEVSQVKNWRMVLYNRGAPREIASRFHFGYHAVKMNADVIRSYESVVDESGERHRAEIQTVGLKGALRNISEDFGFDPNATEVVYDRIEPVHEPGKDLILALLPKASTPAARMLQRQAKHCIWQAFKQSRQFGYPVSPGIIGIPFARLPRDISNIQYSRMIEGLQAEMPVRVVLGDVEVDFKG